MATYSPCVLHADARNFDIMKRKLMDMFKR